MKLTSWRQSSNTPGYSSFRYRPALYSIHHGSGCILVKAVAQLTLVTRTFPGWISRLRLLVFEKAGPGPGEVVRGKRSM